MLKLTEIARNCYYFQGDINIGYVRSEHEGLLIDAGLEASTMKKVLRQLDELHMPVTHLILTHCHADHYGGAAYLQSNRDVSVYSTKLEAAIAENPIMGFLKRIIKERSGRIYRNMNKLLLICGPF
ncbi:MBL fold metallo-hydrolase [Peribacillus acanthi]|uniref:MBL fold metallo-hydrolase n=1 Tax=Peribacillus acanthi TaxID=2171554 RepID=UPI0013008403|nr:MBL fold metallo-hydrolase [Peribacillus acanthi]